MAATAVQPTYKLYSPPGSFRAFAALIAAEYNGVHIEVVTANIEQTIAWKSPTGKAPILECVPSNQIIFSSHAMTRFVASLRTDSVLLGSTVQERMAIDEWMDWVACEVELPACVWFYPVAGYMTNNTEATSKAKKDFGAALQLLETYLSKQPRELESSCPFLVKRSQISLADVVVVSTLLYPFKLVCDEAYLKPYPTVVKWFRICVSRPEFVAVVGKVELYKEG